MTRLNLASQENFIPNSGSIGPSRRNVLTLMAALPFNATRIGAGVAEMATPVLSGPDSTSIERVRAIKGALDVGSAALSIVETATGIDRRSLPLGLLPGEVLSSGGEETRRSTT